MPRRRPRLPQTSPVATPTPEPDRSATAAAAVDQVRWPLVARLGLALAVTTVVVAIVAALVAAFVVDRDDEQGVAPAQVNGIELL